tara:strand:+ start:850 stop:1266 length:417 start_codon:yes stop_codon:yes gene_type:complete
MKYIIILTISFLTSPVTADDQHYSDSNVKLFFITPKDGEILTSPFIAKFGITGMSIAPAGIDKPMSGHHHLLIDLDKLPDMNNPIPADKNHLHFGQGQTQASINLPSGKHTLQLLLGNYLHIPHRPPLLSERIEITVK